MNKERYQEKMLQTESNSIVKELTILFVLVFLSFVSVFGLYNTFSDYNLFNFLWAIPDSTEKYANFAIAILFAVTMGILQGVNFKKKTLMGKLSFIFFVLAMVVSIVSIVLFFTNSLVPPVMTILIVGITMYLFDLVFMTIGLKGFFFFLLVFSFGLIEVYKQGYHSGAGLFTIGEIFLALILFISATYPRLKSLFFKIGTRDNIDISNTGSDDNSGEDDE
jgi:hypothetical protein